MPEWAEGSGMPPPPGSGSGTGGSGSGGSGSGGSGSGGNSTGALEEQTIAWVRGMSPAQLCVTPGTRVTFDWTSGHNMQEVTEDSYESCTGFAKTSPEAGPTTWMAPAVLGNNYFACGVPGHCSDGMKAMVEVKAVCPT